MQASFGHNHNIYDYESERAFPYSFAALPIKKAQRILYKEDEIETIHWQKLCQDLYKCVLKCSLNTGNTLTEVTKTVIDWGSKEQKSSFTELKGQINMKMLDSWQRRFLDLLQRQVNTVEIHFFKRAESENVWVVTKDPSTEDVLLYSQLYVDFLDQYPGLFFEFIVFGEDEIDKKALPKDTKTFN